MGIYSKHDLSEDWNITVPHLKLLPRDLALLVEQSYRHVARRSQGTKTKAWRIPLEDPTVFATHRVASANDQSRGCNCSKDLSLSASPKAFQTDPLATETHRVANRIRWAQHGLPWFLDCLEPKALGFLAEPLERRRRTFGRPGRSLGRSRVVSSPANEVKEVLKKRRFELPELSMNMIFTIYLQ